MEKQSLWTLFIPAFLAVAVVFYLQLVILVRPVVAGRSPRFGPMFTPILINSMVFLTLVLLCWRSQEMDQHPGRKPSTSLASAVSPLFVAAIFRILLTQDPPMPHRR